MTARSPFIPYDDSPTTDDQRDVEMIRVGRWPAQPVEWLWPDRIPVGKVTLLVGDPGCGKSLVALDIAARVSRAAPWPDSHSSFDIRHSSFTDPETNSNPQSAIPNPKSPPPSSVLILSAEDDLTETIRPRLDAAGADCDRIFFLPAIADLRHDFDQLYAAVDRAGDCRLIIIDPINAYIGPCDSHFHTVVRRVLAPLAKLAHERRIAVLAVAHLRKTDGAAIYRAAGSMGFVAAARAVWTVCRDQSNPGGKLFLPLKNNLVANACGLAYSIQPNPAGDPVIQWQTTPITAPTEVLLARPCQPRPQRCTERSEAAKWLREVLADGPRPARVIIQLGQERGFLPRTLQRAFHEIDGHTAKRGLHQGWWWSLTDLPAQADSHLTSKQADAFEGVSCRQDIADQIAWEQMWSNLPASQFHPIPSTDSLPPAAPKPQPSLADRPPSRSSTISILKNPERQPREGMRELDGNSSRRHSKLRDTSHFLNLLIEELTPI